MADMRRDQLIALGSEALADHLLALAATNQGAAHLVHCLTASPEELLASFTRKLDDLREEDAWLDRKESDSLAERLEQLVDELAASGVPPGVGLGLVIQFFLSDEAILERCDDSSAKVGEVFTDSLTHLFWAYAKEVSDRERLFDTVLELVEGDCYGVRVELINHAHEGLGQAEVMRLITRLENALEADGTPEKKYLKRQMILSLSRQVGDAARYEQTYRDTYGTLTGDALLILARMMTTQGAHERALAYLGQMDSGYNHERNALQREIHAQLGNREAVTDLLLQEFRISGSVEDFEELVAYAGEEVRTPLLEAEVAKIEKDGVLKLRNLLVLMDFSLFKEAEEYLMRRSAQIDGEEYWTYVPIAQQLYGGGCYLASTLIYRRLIESILSRGRSRAYHHGVDYLRILDFIGALIEQWGPLEEHQRYRQALYGTYKSKYSFWNNYEMAKRSHIDDVRTLFTSDWDEEPY